MTVLFAVVLTVLAFTFIVYPLFKRRPGLMDTSDAGKLQELFSKRDTTYSMIKELEFDLQSGTLNEDDYRELEEKYKGEAVSVLKDIDNLDKGNDVDVEIEKQVLELRRSKGRFCPQCGVKVQESDRFCSRCGASLGSGEGID